MKNKNNKKGKNNRQARRKLIFIEVGGRQKIWVNHFPAKDSGKTWLKVAMSKEMENLIDKPGEVDLKQLFCWIENRVLRYLGYQENDDFSNFKELRNAVAKDRNLTKTIDLVVESVARVSRGTLKQRKYGKHAMAA